MESDPTPAASSQTQPPPLPQAQPDPRSTPDATGGIIPYKNPAALIGYYLGIFGMFPLLGLPLAIAALVLGIVGLRRRAQGKAYGGSVHAWVAIVLGSIASLYNGFFVFLIVAAAVSG
ncbi:hypothetical protein AY599_18430 [Leptolyngbya valderiana BDU 20041]|nr:hypothetical protein AY599_18430 [Leptolyngbya valderiana BDU 20041]